MRIIELENALDALSVSKGTFTDSPTEYNGRVTKCEVTRKKTLCQSRQRHQRSRRHDYEINTKNESLNINRDKKCSSNGLKIFYIRKKKMLQTSRATSEKHTTLLEVIYALKGWARLPPPSIDHSDRRIHVYRLSARVLVENRKRVIDRKKVYTHVFLRNEFQHPQHRGYRLKIEFHAQMHLNSRSTLESLQIKGRLSFHRFDITKYFDFEFIFFQF